MLAFFRELVRVVNSQKQSFEIVSRTFPSDNGDLIENEIVEKIWHKASHEIRDFIDVLRLQIIESNKPLLTLEPTTFENLSAIFDFAQTIVAKYYNNNVEIRLGTKIS